MVFRIYGIVFEPRLNNTNAYIFHIAMHNQDVLMLFSGLTMNSLFMNLAFVIVNYSLKYVKNRK